MSDSSSPVLVTRAAGFVGAALCVRLLERGDRAIGIDSPNSYYNPKLKHTRLVRIEAIAASGSGPWCFKPIALEDSAALQALFAAEKPRAVVNLAAQASARYSPETPATYIQSNVAGFDNALEACRNYGAQNLARASISSAYGGSRNLPFHEHQPVNHPASLYPASKKANELMAHTYSHLYSLPATRRHFFTVYGP